jgi:DNA invertase Pin-like site-specific DNA recombinase
MTHFIRAYLRASTNEQDAQRARGSLDRFAHEHGVVILYALSVHFGIQNVRFKRLLD